MTGSPRGQSSARSSSSRDAATVIQAVLFDGDQTLWDFERVMRDALIAVLGELRAERPGPRHRRVDVAATSRTTVGGGGGTGRHRVQPGPATRARVLPHAERRPRPRRAATRRADAALAEWIAASYFEHRDRDPALFPDTLPCLQALRDRYRLGLLSNGSRLPEKVGLAGYFESVVFAQDHRVAKPDKGIFEVVERELGLPSEDVRAGRRPPAQRRRRGQARRVARRVARPPGRGCGGGRPAFWQLHDCDEQPDAVVSSLSDLPGHARLARPGLTRCSMSSARHRPSSVNIDNPIYSRR